MKFRPLHDRVVVKRVEEDTKTKGGIIIPDTAQEKPMQGKVIAIGPGGRDEAGKLIPIDVKVGDVVFIASPGAVATPSTVASVSMISRVGRFNVHTSPVAEVHHPDPAVAPVYRRLLDAFVDAHDRWSPTFRILNARSRASDTTPDHQEASS